MLRDDVLEALHELLGQHELKHQFLTKISNLQNEIIHRLKHDETEEIDTLLQQIDVLSSEIDTINFAIGQENDRLCRVCGIELSQLAELFEDQNSELATSYLATKKRLETTLLEMQAKQEILIKYMEELQQEYQKDMDDVRRINRLKNRQDLLEREDS